MFDYNPLPFSETCQTFAVVGLYHIITSAHVLGDANLCGSLRDVVMLLTCSLGRVLLVVLHLAFSTVTDFLTQLLRTVRGSC